MQRFLVLILLLSVTLGLLPGDQAAAANKRTFVYLSDDGIQIFGFELASSGALTQLGNSPFDTGVADPHSCSDECDSLAFLPGRSLLFAGTNEGIVVFRVAASGDLTEVSGSPFG